VRADFVLHPLIHTGLELNLTQHLVGFSRECERRKKEAPTDGPQEVGSSEVLIGAEKSGKSCES